MCWRLEESEHTVVVVNTRRGRVRASSILLSRVIVRYCSDKKVFVMTIVEMVAEKQMQFTYFSFRLNVIYEMTLLYDDS